jgi:hypothetical protein
MSVQSGNVSGSRTLTPFNINSRIISFSLANKTAGAITARVGIIYGSTFDILYNTPLAAAGSAGCGFIYVGNPIELPAYNAIFVSFSGLCDYFFTIE